MSEVPSIQPPQQLLELIGRPYKKRDEILESSNRLVDYSYRLQNCGESELEALQSEIRKEVNRIISDINGLAPLLKNANIVSILAELTTGVNQTLEDVRLAQEIRDTVARIIRNALCPIANMTRLELTPKSFKKAYGVEIGIKDIVKLKGFYEHQQDNY